MERIIIKKENGEVRLVNANEELLHSIKVGYTNPCIECKKGNVIDCKKVADGEKKHIEKYDFITDGYQINDSNGQLENLVVYKCSNYEKQEAKPKPTTKEELQELKRLKESIKILYFNAEDIDEANRIQSDLTRRGQLVEYNPSLNGLRKSK